MSRDAQSSVSDDADPAFADSHGVVVGNESGQGGSPVPDRSYEIRVTGLVLTEDLLSELGDVEIAEHELRTVLSGRFSDQAALYGFLHRLRTFGLEVVEVRRLAGPEERTDEGAEEVEET